MSFRRTIRSHGCASLPPSAIDAHAPAYETSLRIGEKRYRLHFSERASRLRIATDGSVNKAHVAKIEAIAVRMFRLDQNLAPFYARIADDPQLAWAAQGAGRLLASATIFEDVIKTICTTNCAWSATIRMTSALVELGEGVFPTPQLLAQTPEAWFRDVARMGYRGPYVKRIAADVASGALDLEAFLPERGLPDDAVEDALLALPGVGPYAAAHIMQLLGWHRRLILDSWTRPTFLRLAKKQRATDTTIRRAFARYDEYAGLAFWLYLTREWVEET